MCSRFKAIAAHHGISNLLLVSCLVFYLPEFVLVGVLRFSITNEWILRALELEVQVLCKDLVDVSDIDGFIVKGLPWRAARLAELLALLLFLAVTLVLGSCVLKEIQIVVTLHF